MNGAESLVRTFIDSGVDVCFTNPGTSEMHVVAALDQVPGMRSVLGLQENVATGAADGYYRMTQRPASTLLHLGPGLANGLANLHNARKAYSGVVNVVGDHAVPHQQYDTALTTDLDAVAAPMSDVVIRTTAAEDTAADGARAITAAQAGRVATLILPADAAWGDATGPAIPPTPAPPPAVDNDLIATAAEALRSGRKVALLLGGPALRGEALELAGRVAAKTGCEVLSENMVARLERGAGRVQPTRLPYPANLAAALLAPFADLVLIGARPPVNLFAHPDRPSVPTAPDCRLTALAGARDDVLGALRALADTVDATDTPPAAVAAFERPDVPVGPLTPESLGVALAALLPEQAIVVDEAVTSGRGIAAPTSSSVPHDWLSGTGGAIGFGMPCAVGAAVACPDRPVICLEGDGSGMYTVQSLWTMARESLNIVVIVFANRSYRILHSELDSIGARPGPKSAPLLNLDGPHLDWAGLAQAQGVPATRVDDLAGFVSALQRGLATPGPSLIEVLI